MSGYQEKFTRHTKRQKAQFEKTEQTSGSHAEPDSVTTGVLELSD